MTTKKSTKSTASIHRDDVIEILGAREHNLRVDRLVIPKHSLVVFTGPSGSGKSSLAFDTLYAEGQRRYVESLSAYARQFLGRLERPAVERIRGLAPTIAIEQKSASGNPRSTVGTITEVYDYLRVLYSRAGRQHCVTCGKLVRGRSVDEVVSDVLAHGRGRRVHVLAPLAENRKGEFKDVLTGYLGRGFARVRIDGVVHSLEEIPAIDKKKKHTVELVIDRLSSRPEDRKRLGEAVELALKEAKGECLVLAEGEGEVPARFSESRSCCGTAYPELSPASFSFNGPLGMCPACNGLGTRLEMDATLIVPDPTKSIHEGAIAPWSNAVDRAEGWTYRIIEAMAQATGVDLDKPWKKLPEKQQQQVLYGLEGKRMRVQWGKEGSESHGSWAIKFHGVIPTLMRRYQETTSERMRELYRKYLRDVPCDACKGRRLRAESLAVQVGTLDIAALTHLSVDQCEHHIANIELSRAETTIAEGVLREVRARLGFLRNVGLGYLTLDRGGPTLSGGEAQRIRLASQLGSELTGVLYVLDEPSIGLHPRDNQKLLRALEGLRDLGNSVIVVEHDEDTMRAADHIVEFGPGAGHLGGQVIFEGTPAAIEKAKNSATGDFLSGRRKIAIPESRRKSKAKLTIRGAREHNLQNITVDIPLGCLVAITGPSGAGKSTLVQSILLPALSAHLHGASESPGLHDGIDGIDALDKVIAINQQPIGRTPRSNPGTYTKLFDDIREAFSQLPESRARGFEASRFSFNVKGGRCESCQGDGVTKVEMHFLSDVYVTCEVCNGRRYNEATLAVRYRGKSITDVLDLSVDECQEIFSAHPGISRGLATLQAVGLGYMKLGQRATTLSGGEAQRIKLSRELARKQTGRTLYVLDEPTTGLHFVDVEKLLAVLQRLVDAGNSVLVIEHNLDVVRAADWVIDLGPDGGVAGGKLVAQGTPEQLAKNKKSPTAPFVASILAR
ncbi:MAG: excinuclease ABC subunit UvrA [Deltaproteobacteria bacterium]|nr:excinuclease ABC subunit UvrA [Deltaproteobacteria bacterium]